MVRLGIVGTDHVAERMIKCARQLKDVHVTAIATTSQGSAAILARSVNAAACEDADDLSTRSDVDAVYVASRNPDHASDTRAAIAAGKPVLVQKPIALTPSESASVIAAAKAKNVLLLENLWCLTVPAAQALIERSDAELMGTPLQFSLDFGYPVKPELYPALFSPELGVLRDRGCYGIAFARRLLGPISEISAQVTWQGNVDTSTIISLKHQSGALSKLGFSFDALLSNKATLSCSGGFFGLEPSLGGQKLTNQVAEVQIGPLTKPKRRSIRSFPMTQVLRRLRASPRQEKLPFGSDLHLPMLRHFVDLVKAGQTESHLVPLDLSLETQELVEKARERLDAAA